MSEQSPSIECQQEHELRLAANSAGFHVGVRARKAGFAKPDMEEPKSLTSANSGVSYEVSSSMGDSYEMGFRQGWMQAEMQARGVR